MLSLSGTGIGRGIAIGRAIVLDQGHNDIPCYRISATALSGEIERFNHAVDAVRTDLKRVQRNLPTDAPPETSAFIDVHLLMLDDPVISQQPVQTIQEQQQNAEWALKSHADTLIDFFEDIADPYLRSKKNDVAQVVGRIMGELAHSQGKQPSDLATLGSSLAEQVGVSDILEKIDQRVGVTF